MEELEKNFLLELKGARLQQTLNGILGEIIKETVDCPFGEFYLGLVGADPHWFIRGGTVIGGTGNITVEDTDIGTADPPPDEGTFTWLHITLDAITEDDVLLPGGNVSDAVIEYGDPIPDNVLPTYDAPVGELYLELAKWTNGRWAKSGCGNFQISHCPGSLYYARG